MITLLDNNKSLSSLVNDNTNGIGVLSSCTEAKIEEEINGIYELNFIIPYDDKHYNDIKIGGIVRCKAGETEGNQLFRIDKLSKVKNGLVSVHCSHITYDLNKTVVLPFNASSASEVCSKLISNMLGEYPFTMTTNISSNVEFINEIPRSFRECLGGWEGSVLDKYRCEYEWDNLNVKMLSRRGQDTVITIAYGKNLTDLTQEENIESVFNACIGYATYDDNGDRKTIVGDIQYLSSTNYPRVKIVDFSGDFNEVKPTKQELNTKALDYGNSNKINVPSVNLTVSFIPLWQTEEYKNIAPLEQVNLGDTITVDFPKLNVSARARVIKRTWNVLTERYDSIELGDAKSNLSSIIDSSIGALYQNLNYTNKIVLGLESTTNAALNNSTNAEIIAGDAETSANEALQQANNAASSITSLQVQINTINGDITDLDNNKVNRSGDTMTGKLIVNGLAFSGGAAGQTSPPYFLCLNQSFANGGNVGYVSKANMLSAISTSDYTRISPTITPSSEWAYNRLIRRYGKVRSLDINCQFSSSYSGLTKILQLDTADAPGWSASESWNIHPGSGTSNPYITIDSAGGVYLGGYTANVVLRATLVWITA